LQKAQTVSQMAQKVLMRQAKALGEPKPEALRTTKIAPHPDSSEAPDAE
jgi:hypothetical protein